MQYFLLLVLIILLIILTYRSASRSKTAINKANSPLQCDMTAPLQSDITAPPCGCDKFTMPIPSSQSTNLPIGAGVVAAVQHNDLVQRNIGGISSG